jgi:hypothetical protein
MSHAVFLQFLVGTYKNNGSPKITLAYILTLAAVDVRELELYQKYIFVNYSWGKINQT